MATTNSENINADSEAEKALVQWVITEYPRTWEVIQQIMNDARACESQTTEKGYYDLLIPVRQAYTMMGQAMGDGGTSSNDGQENALPLECPSLRKIEPNTAREQNGGTGDAVSAEYASARDERRRNTRGRGRGGRAPAHNVVSTPAVTFDQQEKHPNGVGDGLLPGEHADEMDVDEDEDDDKDEGQDDEDLDDAAKQQIAHQTKWTEAESGTTMRDANKSRQSETPPGDNHSSDRLYVKQRGKAPVNGMGNARRDRDKHNVLSAKYEVEAQKGMKSIAMEKNLVPMNGKQGLEGLEELFRAIALDFQKRKRPLQAVGQLLRFVKHFYRPQTWISLANTLETHQTLWKQGRSIEQQGTTEFKKTVRSGGDNNLQLAILFVARCSGERADLHLEWRRRRHLYSLYETRAWMAKKLNNNETDEVYKTLGFTGGPAEIPPALGAAVKGRDPEKEALILLKHHYDEVKQDSGRDFGVIFDDLSDDVTLGARLHSLVKRGSWGLVAFMLCCPQVFQDLRMQRITQDDLDATLECWKKLDPQMSSVLAFFGLSVEKFLDREDDKDGLALDELCMTIAQRLGDVGTGESNAIQTGQETPFSGAPLETSTAPLMLEDDGMQVDDPENRANIDIEDLREMRLEESNATQGNGKDRSPTPYNGELETRISKIRPDELLGA